MVGANDVGGTVGRSVGVTTGVGVVDGDGVTVGTGVVVGTGEVAGSGVGARVAKRASHVSTSKKLAQSNSQSVRFSWKQPLPGRS